MRNAAVFQILIVFVLFSGCRSDKRDWESVRASDTRQDYVIFLNQHPRSKFCSAAQKRIKFFDDSLDFERIKKEFSIKSCNDYILSSDNNYFIEKCKRLKKEIKHGWQSELSDVDTIFIKFDFTGEASSNNLPGRIIDGIGNELKNLDIKLTSIVNYENHSDLKIQIIFEGRALSNAYNMTLNGYKKYTGRQYSGAITNGKIKIIKEGSTIFLRTFYKKTPPPISIAREYSFPKSAPFHHKEFAEFAIEEIHKFISANSESKIEAKSL